ncbi:hypothetical protein [Succinivibrio dextrinosolvens]|uniref:hypothetical protein n=1 Tax=Succinivibrio dextrinosolvens TaxID=83771 RepID=UPI00241ECA43|nr:hypothetical protein [Succinivibrio dextrinosolvens]MBE6422898.1 hypothetical protein [Succinivibrio dextrinosolvens]
MVFIVICVIVALCNVAKLAAKAMAKKQETVVLSSKGTIHVIDGKPFRLRYVGKHLKTESEEKPQSKTSDITANTLDLRSPFERWEQDHQIF